MSSPLPSKPFGPATTIAALIECDAITEALDEEHKTLYEGLTALSNAVTDGAGQESLAHILDEVECFCIAHFESEERFFRDQTYAKLGAHQAAHRQLIQRLGTVRTAISSGLLTASDVSTLIDGFNNHVVAFDKPAHVWSLWQHIEEGSETPQHVWELCSLDRLGKISWNASPEIPRPQSGAKSQPDQPTPPMSGNS